MNRAALARRSGVSARSIAGYEAGWRRPNRATLARLAAVLGGGLLPAE
jgi:transcriptional regulator with XRE-family HTH domain